DRAERAFFQDDEDDPSLGRRKMNRQRLDRETFSHDFKHWLGKDRKESGGCNKVVTQHAGVGADNRRREGQSVRVKGGANIPSTDRVGWRHRPMFIDQIGKINAPATGQRMVRTGNGNERIVIKSLYDKLLCAEGFLVRCDKEFNISGFQVLLKLGSTR